MYETLTRYGSQTEHVVPMLATAWFSTDDGKTWAFTLLDGVKFHTGRTIASADVKASIERTLDLNQGAAYIWSAVKSIDTPDPQDGGIPSQVLGAARPDRLRGLRRLHLRYPGCGLEGSRQVVRSGQ